MFGYLTFTKLHSFILCHLAGSRVGDPQCGALQNHSMGPCQVSNYLLCRNLCLPRQKAASNLKLPTKVLKINLFSFFTQTMSDKTFVQGNQTLRSGLATLLQPTSCPSWCEKILWDTCICLVWCFNNWLSLKFSSWILLWMKTCLTLSSVLNVQKHVKFFTLLIFVKSTLSNT